MTTNNQTAKVAKPDNTKGAASVRAYAKKRGEARQFSRSFAFWVIENPASAPVLDNIN